jgi:hypothetical protein
MWKSLLEYIKALGWWSWVVLLGIIGAVTGVVLDVSGIKFPTIVWVSLLAIGLPIASFFAFHKVRLQRDALSNKDEFFFEPTGSSVLTKTGVMHINVTFRARPKVIVDKLYLDISGERFAPLEWMPFSVSP